MPNHNITRRQLVRSTAALFGLGACAAVARPVIVDATPIEVAADSRAAAVVATGGTRSVRRASRSESGVQALMRGIRLDGYAAPEPPLADRAMRALGLEVSDPEPNLVDARQRVMVQYTLLDGETIGGAESLDELWLEADADVVSEQLITSTFQIEPVWDAEASADEYVVALPGATHPGMRVLECVFSHYDPESGSIGDARVDVANGIAYVPKEWFEGVELADQTTWVQVQVVLATTDGFDGIDIEVEIKCAGRMAPGVVCEVDPLDLDFAFPVVDEGRAGDVAATRLDVRVNDCPWSLLPGTFAYDAESGYVRLVQAPLGIKSLSVEILDREADVVVRARAAGWVEPRVSVDAMGVFPFGTFDNLSPSAIPVGTRIVYKCREFYNYRSVYGGYLFQHSQYCAESINNTYRYVFNGDENGVSWSAIVNGGANLGQFNNVQHPIMGQYGATCFTLPGDWCTNFWQNTAALPASDGKTYDLRGLTKTGGAYDNDRGSKETLFNSDRTPAIVVAGRCCHTSTPNGPTHNYSGHPDDGLSAGAGDCYLRVLATGNDYVVMGFAVPKIGIQASSCAIKFRANGTGWSKADKNEVHVEWAR